MTSPAPCPSLGRWLRYTRIDPTRSDPDTGCLLLYGCVLLQDIECVGHTGGHVFHHQGDIFEYVWVCYEEGMLECIQSNGARCKIPMLDTEP